MNKQILTVTIIVVVGFLAIYGFKGNADGSGGTGSAWQEKISWSEPSITAEQVAAAGKPIYLFMSTEWCTFCKKMKAETFSQPGIQDILNDRFINITLNPELQGTASFTGEDISYADLARKLGVSGYPASFFFTPEGNLIGGQPGYLGPEDFEALGRYVGGGFYKDYKFDEFMRLPQEEQL